MAKAVLISIRPEWVAKIANKIKTVEVRKTKPNLKTPFKCYIYCTNTRPFLIWDDVFNGHVAGEFVCDRIDTINPKMEPYGIYDVDDDFVAQTRLVNGALWDYGKGATLYGWHIVDLRIYDQLRELTEFRRPCPNDLYCETCAMYSNNTGICNNGALPLRRPPQSWCYVEELK